MESFSRKIRSLRLMNKYTREQVANLLAISNEEYIKLEVGEKNPNRELILDFRCLFGGTAKEWDKYLPKKEPIKIVTLED